MLKQAIFFEYSLLQKLLCSTEKYVCVLKLLKYINKLILKSINQFNFFEVMPKLTIASLFIEVTMFYCL